MNEEKAIRVRDWIEDDPDLNIVLDEHCELLFRRWDEMFPFVVLADSDVLALLDFLQAHREAIEQQVKKKQQGI